eukprot:Clim_evm110s25 gene=Clim_evmTU110s25
MADSRRKSDQEKPSSDGRMTIQEAQRRGLLQKSQSVRETKGGRARRNRGGVPVHMGTTGSGHGLNLSSSGNPSSTKTGDNWVINLDGNASALTCSTTGDLVAIAQRNKIQVVQLGQRGVVAKGYVEQQKSWGDITALRFTKGTHNQGHLAAAINNVISLWDVQAPKANVVAGGSNAQAGATHVTEFNRQLGQRVCEFHGHTRAVRSIDWNRLEPSLMVSCSEEAQNGILLWDTRTKGSPILGPTEGTESGGDAEGVVEGSVAPISRLRSWNGATKAVWNRRDRNTLVTLSEHDVRIWDIRRPTAPSADIAAHYGKIYGVDWSYQRDHEFVTCSEDQTIKFWSAFDTVHAQRIVKVQAAVLRCFYTPVGAGLVALAMNPQRLDNPMILFNLATMRPSMQFLQGHTDIVRDACWRPLSGDYMDGSATWELVTLGKDRTIRRWNVTEALQMLQQTDGGQNNFMQIAEGALMEDTTADTVALDERSAFGVTDDDDSKLTFSSATVGAPTPILQDSSLDVAYDAMSGPLEHLGNQSGLEIGTDGQRLAGSRNMFWKELQLINVQIPGVVTEKTNPKARTCVIGITGSENTLSARLRVEFPVAYPEPGAEPIFRYQVSTPGVNLRSLKERVKECASECTRHRRPCLAHCLKIIMEELESTAEKPQFGPTTSLPSNLDSTANERVPFPRFCGALFTPTGQLLHWHSLPARYEPMLRSRRGPLALPRSYNQLPEFLRSLVSYEEDSRGRVLGLAELDHGGSDQSLTGKMGSALPVHLQPRPQSPVRRGSYTVASLRPRRSITRNVGETGALGGAAFGNLKAASQEGLNKSAADGGETRSEGTSRPGSSAQLRGQEAFDMEIHEEVIEDTADGTKGQETSIGTDQAVPAEPVLTGPYAFLQRAQTAPMEGLGHAKEDGGGTRGTKSKDNLGKPLELPQGSSTAGSSPRESPLHTKQSSPRRGAAGALMVRKNSRLAVGERTGGHRRNLSETRELASIADGQSQSGSVGHDSHGDSVDDNGVIEANSKHVQITWRTLIGAEDLRSLFLASEALAKRYVLNGGSTKELCEKNSHIALQFNRRHTGQLWTLLKEIADPTVNDSVSETSTGGGIRTGGDTRRSSLILPSDATRTSGSFGVTLGQMNSLTDVNQRSYGGHSLLGPGAPLVDRTRSVPSTTSAPAPIGGTASDKASSHPQRSSPHNLNTTSIDSSELKPVVASVPSRQQVFCEWAEHPFGRTLLKELMEEFVEPEDVQTIAMTAFFLFAYDDAIQQETAAQFSDSGMIVAKASNPPMATSNRRLIDDGLRDYLTPYMVAYANVLDRWGLQYTSAEFRQYIPSRMLDHRQIEFQSTLSCSQCGPLSSTGPTDKGGRTSGSSFGTYTDHSDLPAFPRPDSLSDRTGVSVPPHLKDSHGTGARSSSYTNVLLSPPSQDGGTGVSNGGGSSAGAGLAQHHRNYSTGGAIGSLASSSHEWSAQSRVVSQGAASTQHRTQQQTSSSNRSEGRVRHKSENCHSGGTGRRIACAICLAEVRGMVTVCPCCGHGGHPNHMKQWFQLEHTCCPVGDCKCRCKPMHPQGCE